MYHGDRSRKQTLVDYGFRLPSALDNRPLNFAEFNKLANQIVYISATPGDYELELAPPASQQVIRPTGLLDPQVVVLPIEGQINDLVDKISDRTKKGQRVLVTTLTKKMAENLSDYLKNLKIKVAYLHSEIDTLERSEILADLRQGVYDVLVGINLLREGLDLPEVSLVAILDADKEGFLRSKTSLIQTIGRAARHLEGLVVMYADEVTSSMEKAIAETNRRRKIQQDYNQKNKITPTALKKGLGQSYLPTPRGADSLSRRQTTVKIDQVALEEVPFLIEKLTAKMKLRAANLEFEKAQSLKEQIEKLRARI